MGRERLGVRGRYRRAGELFMESVPSTPRSLRAFGFLGTAVMATLAGVSLLLGDLADMEAYVAGAVMLAIAALSLSVSISGMRDG